MEPKIIRAQLVDLLTKSNAHMTFAEAVADFPPEHYNTRPPQTPYTFWHLLEHIRLAQRDILDFIRNPDYQERNWPEDYWPPQNELADSRAWEKTISAFYAELDEIVAIISDPQIDLAGELPYAPGYTYLREFLLVADHNAYHLGEFAILRGILGLWKKSDKPEKDKI